MPMASGRIERMLGEIARLSEDEQDELVRGLPKVLHRAGSSGGLTTAAVEKAVDARERIRRRLVEAGQTPGSISADLDSVREERLADLSDGGAVPPRQV
jgi:predicted nuclease of restriction endonuclease-like RecB superfamily